MHAIIAARLCTPMLFSPFPFPSISLSTQSESPSCLSPMTTSPKRSPRFPTESRAPPPSPVAGAPPNEPWECDDLSKFLGRSFRVPQLILPDRIASKEIAAADAFNPPEISLRTLISPEDDGSTVELLRSAARSFGCFQLVNHEIPSDLIAKAGVVASRAFSLSPEEKETVSRSPETGWGFEFGEEDGGNEFFWWFGRREEGTARSWRQDYRELGDVVELLQEELVKIGSKIAGILDPMDHLCADGSVERIGGGSALRVLRHRNEQWDHNHCGSQAGSMKHDVLRMLIGSWGCSHALCLHICPGAFRFCIYVKKGWLRFRPRNDAVMVTIGDQIQACRSGLYKHVVGKAVFAFANGDHDEERPISIAFFCSRPTMTTISYNTRKAAAGVRTVSLFEQVLVAACLTLFYYVLAHIYGNS